MVAREPGKIRHVRAVVRSPVAGNTSVPTAGSVRPIANPRRSKPLVRPPAHLGRLRREVVIAIELSAEALTYLSAQLVVAIEPPDERI